MQQKVIVIGRNYTSRLGMIRAVGMAGYDVTVIKTNGKNSKDIDAYSKYVKEYLYAREPDRKKLLEVLMSLKSDNGKSIIIPVDDYAASTIDDNIDILKAYFLFPNVNMASGAINRLMDKEYQKDLARKAGLNVAEGWTIEVKNGKYELPKDIKYPCFPKPQISFMGNKRCMKRCNTEQELKTVLDGVAAVRNCPILIEQYIEIEKEYATLGFCDGTHMITPAVIHLLDQGNGGHRGVAKIGKLLPSEAFLTFFHQLEEFFRGLNFVGLFDVDMYESKGIIYFNELNLRFGASGYAITHQGINLPEMMINKLLDSKIESTCDSKIAGTFVNEKVNFEDYLAGYYGWREYKRINGLADFRFLDSHDDPIPYKVFLRKSVWKIFKRIVKKMIHKL